MIERIFRLLFPYRTHLEEEIDYLRGQLAQKQRRIDELQDALASAARANPRISALPTPKISQPPAPPRGWEAYRAAHKETDDHKAKQESPARDEARDAAART